MSLQNNYERLLITAYLEKPVFINGRMCFDGILFHAINRRVLGEDSYNLPMMGKEEKIRIRLPIQRKKDVYLASWARYSIKKEFIDKWRKRFNILLAEEWKDDKKFRIDSTATKDYDMPITLTIPKDNKISWIVVGNRKEIEELVKDIYFIGKKSSQGWGKVKKWEITTTTKKGCRLFPVFNKEQLPKEDLVFYESCYPPYPNPKNKRYCVVRKF